MVGVKYVPRDPVGYGCINVLVQKAISKVIGKAKARVRSKAWHEANKEHANDACRQRHADNKDHNHRVMKANHEAKRDERLVAMKGYRESHREERSKYAKDRRLNDEMFKLAERARGAVNRLKQRHQGERTGSTCDMIGKTFAELGDHLEKQLDGRTIYEVDHIFPVSRYGGTENKEKKLMHWSNLQPLTAAENLNKRDKLPTLDMARKVERWAWPDDVSEEDLPLKYDGWATSLKMHAE